MRMDLHTFLHLNAVVATLTVLLIASRFDKLAYLPGLICRIGPKNVDTVSETIPWYYQNQVLNTVMHQFTIL